MYVAVRPVAAPVDALVGRSEGGLRRGQTDGKDHSAQHQPRRCQWGEVGQLEGGAWATRRWRRAFLHGSSARDQKKWWFLV